MPNPPAEPELAVLPVPTSVKLATSGIVSGVALKPDEQGVAPVGALHPSFSIPCGSVDVPPALGRLGVSSVLWNAMANWIRPAYPSDMSKWSSPDSYETRWSASTAPPNHSNESSRPASACR
jgi:hypothetical protein